MIKCKLSQFIAEYGDGIHGTPNYDENGEYYFVNGNNLSDGNIQIDANTLRVNAEEYERIKRPLNDTTILLSINGTLGRTALYNGEKIALGKSACYINIKPEYNREFMQYVLNMDVFRKYMYKVAGGSTIKNFAPSQVGEFEIELPFDNQDKIVEILKPIDTKIKLNNSVISELEAMAKEIYDYWFVQFDFPDENGKPYKSSGGKMVMNEELGREIPEGWESGKLDEIVNVVQNRATKSDLKDRCYVPIEVIPRHKISFYETAALEKAATGLCTFDEGSILLSNRRVYFHKVCISPFKGVTRDTVIVLNPKDNDNLGYVFEIVYSEHFIRYATMNSYGSEQPVLSVPVALNYKFAKPPKELYLKYSKIVKSTIDKVMSLEKENQELTSLRDYLLPLLMNGQVTFSDQEGA